MAVDGHFNRKIMKNHLYQLFPVSWIVLLNSRSPLHMLPRCKGMRCQRSSFLLLRNSRLNDCKDCRDDSEMITICCRPTGIQSHLLGHRFYCFSMLFVFLLLRMVCRYGFSSRSGHSWQILIVTLWPLKDKMAIPNVMWQFTEVWFEKSRVVSSVSSALQFGPSGGPRFPGVADEREAPAVPEALRCVWGSRAAFGFHQSQAHSW